MENKDPNKKRYYHRNKYRRNYSKSSQQPRENKNKTNFKKVSILVPLFNEEESLGPLYSEIKKAVNQLGTDYEIMFVDDGSSDSSLEKIRNFARSDNKVKYISFRKNYGKSAALNAGFKAITGDAVITMDADLQDDPAEISNLVSGWKKIRFDPFIKKHSSKFFNYTTRVLSGIKLHDFNCGLKCYRTEVTQHINVYGELHRYIPVLAHYKGFKITEIPVKHHPRRYGTTKFGISRFFKGFVDLVTVIFNSRYIKRPMHLFGFFGALAFFFGVLVNLWLTFEKIFLGNSIGNRPLLFLGILLIIVGVQFFAVGLLGEIIVYNTPDNDDYSIKEKR